MSELGQPKSRRRADATDAGPGAAISQLAALLGRAADEGEFEQRKDEQAKKGKPKKGPTVKSPAKTAGKVPKQGKTDAT